MLISNSLHWHIKLDRDFVQMYGLGYFLRCRAIRCDFYAESSPNGLSRLYSEQFKARSRSYSPTLPWCGCQRDQQNYSSTAKRVHVKSFSHKLFLSSIRIPVSTPICSSPALATSPSPTPVMRPRSFPTTSPSSASNVASMSPRPRLLKSKRRLLSGKSG